MNCSAFNPTPSLSAAVVNHFKFKSSVRTFNLSGMGCAASVIAVDMARDMLKVGGVPCRAYTGKVQVCCAASVTALGMARDMLRVGPERSFEPKGARSWSLVLCSPPPSILRYGSVSSSAGGNSEGSAGGRRRRLSKGFLGLLAPTPALPYGRRCAAQVLLSACEEGALTTMRAGVPWARGK